MASDEEQESSHDFTNVHPGHFLFFASIPFCYGAYRTFHQPLDEVVRPVLHAHNVPARSIEAAEEPIRRAVASVIAARALKVSSLGSVGAFGLMGAGAFYAFGWKSSGEAVQSMQDWAHERRNRLDSWLGVINRIDHNHAEIEAKKSMSYEEEVAYISKKYLPDEDWEAEADNR